ncbi:hypothetical protein [Chitinophaga sp.]|uniref:hypothetical protein n=1 Tax=Chitinophaga sp. TaxID=1869181 RepID=UPI002C8DE6CF|nr:hypothetical protein [Chitinophaga sp.]HWV64356.1 hypothetical protein [Chitinophaga sp.]
MAPERQRQQDLINSGALNNIGSTRQAEPELDNVEEVFKTYMGKLVQRLVERIDGAGPDGKEISASGRLSESVKFKYTVKGQQYTGEISMADYADWRDKGVRGISAGNKNTTSPYSFKFVPPSANHVAAIEQWIKDKNDLSVVEAPKGLDRIVKKHNTRLNDIVKQRHSLAFAMAYSSKQKGIMPANFKKGALDDIMPEFTQEMAKALAKDVTITLNLSNLL